MSSPISLVIMLLLVAITSTNGFAMTPRVASTLINQRQSVRTVRTEIKMNFFEDAVRFFSNMKKEASAKHILIKGPGATEKLNVIKAELVGAEDLSAAFSDLASKVSMGFCLHHCEICITPSHHNNLSSILSPSSRNLYHTFC